MSWISSRVIVPLAKYSFPNMWARNIHTRELHFDVGGRACCIFIAESMVNHSLCRGSLEARLSALAAQARSDSSPKPVQRVETQMLYQRSTDI